MPTLFRDTNLAPLQLGMGNRKSRRKEKGGLMYKSTLLQVTYLMMKEIDQMQTKLSLDCVYGCSWWSLNFFAYLKIFF